MRLLDLPFDLQVRAGETGAAHRVRSLGRGERLILKILFAPQGAERVPEYGEALGRAIRMRAPRRRAAGGRSRPGSGRRRDA